MSILPKGQTLLNTPRLILDGQVLSFVNKYKYLGTITVNSMSDNDDIERQMRSLYVRINMLLRQFNLCSFDVKLMLFNAFCTNMYCSAMWCDFKVSTMNRIRVAYNNSFRKLICLPRWCSASAMFAFHSVLSFNELQRKIVFNFRQRILQSCNLLIQDVVSVVCFKSSLWRHWCSILY